MNKHPSALHSCAVLLALFLAAPGRGQAPASPLEIKSVAEVQSRATEPKGAPGGRAGAELVPADRVVPGDRVMLVGIGGLGGTMRRQRREKALASA